MQWEVEKTTKISEPQQSAVFTSCQKWPSSVKPTCWSWFKIVCTSQFVCMCVCVRACVITLFLCKSMSQERGWIDHYDFKSWASSKRFSSLLNTSPYMARTVLQTPALHRRLHLINKKITRECKQISSKKNITLVRLSLNKVKSFDWKLLQRELKRHTPTLLSVPQAASCNQPSKRNPQIVRIAAAALLKGRNIVLSRSPRLMLSVSRLSSSEVGDGVQYLLSMHGFQLYKLNWRKGKLLLQLICYVLGRSKVRRSQPSRVLKSMPCALSHLQSLVPD